MAHWIALQPELADARAGGSELTDPVQALGWWALRYTPKVARCNDVLLLEVAASARLWGGLSALLQHVLASNKPVTLAGYAQAATSFIATARLSVAPATPSTVALEVPADALPLHTLAAAQPHLETFARLGVVTWGQLSALPRAGLSRRFGAGLLNALDQAYGVGPDIYPWLTLPEVFDVPLELPSQVESAPALLFAARRLLAQLKVWLQLRHLGVLRLELIWQMDERRHTAHQGVLPLHTAQPTQDTIHLQRLLSEHLAHVSLSAPVHTLRLRTLETQVLGSQSGSLVFGSHREGDGLTQMLERLSARLGADRVLQLQPRMDHRPEQMQAWLSATQSVAVDAMNTRAGGRKILKAKKLAMDAPTFWAQGTAPTWLLTEPLKLAVHQQHPHYQGPLTLLAGPQRLEAGWWGGGELALRDYFVARGSLAVLLWIYRERLHRSASDGSDGLDRRVAQPEWYLHGFFA
jgi:protein ImuB